MIANPCNYLAEAASLSSPPGPLPAVGVKWRSPMMIVRFTTAAPGHAATTRRSKALRWRHSVARREPEAQSLQPASLDLCVRRGRSRFLLRDPRDSPIAYRPAPSACSGDLREVKTTVQDATATASVSEWSTGMSGAARRPRGNSMFSTLIL